MYSRSQNRSEAAIRIPEHYSGCAFSKAPPPEKPREEPPRPRPIEPTRPSPPPKAPPPLLPPPSPTHKEPPPLAESPLGGLGKAFPFSHGVGFEELLLLGLILLLGQSGSDPDMILWLALLLFCG